MSQGALASLDYLDWESRAESGNLVVGGRYSSGRRRQRRVDNGAAKVGFGELGEKSLQVLRENQHAFRLQRATDPGNGLREVAVQHIDGFGGLHAGCKGALENIDQEQAALLEVGQNFIVGLPCRGDGERGEKISGEAGERCLRRIEKLGISVRGGSGEQQSLDMDRAETSGPFEPLQAAGDVLRRSKVAAAVARQKCGDSHTQKW